MVNSFHNVSWKPAGTGAAAPAAASTTASSSSSGGNNRSGLPVNSGTSANVAGAAAPAASSGATAAAQRQLPPALQAFEAKWNARRQRRQQEDEDEDEEEDKRNRRIAAGRSYAVQQRVAQDTQLRLAKRGALPAAQAATVTRPGLTCDTNVRNDTLTCTRCYAKADRDYNGACNMLQLGLHHAWYGDQLSRPSYLDFGVPLPPATAAWIKQRRNDVWQRQCNIDWLRQLRVNAAVRREWEELSAL
jgi:hypothetical protein